MYSEAQEIAARCLAGPQGDAGLLHYQLANQITMAERMVAAAGGELKSRQVITLLVLIWMGRNPGEKAYGE